MKKYKVGYTQGVFDMFHIGHLNLLNNAKAMCDYLIVGINSDELVQRYKNKTPVVNEVNRAQIVSNIKVVDECVIVKTLDKVEVRGKINFDAIFIGSDWKGDARWEQTIQDLQPFEVDVVFLPHTDNISSTYLRDKERIAVHEI